MSRSNRGYIDPEKEAKRKKNLEKLDKRNAKKVVRTIQKDKPRVTQEADIPRRKIAKAVKDYVEFKKEFDSLEKGKRKNLKEAERRNDRLEADRLRRELNVLVENNKKKLRTVGSRLGTLEQSVSQEILKLERQKILLRNKKDSKVSIQEIESRKRYLEEIKKGIVSIDPGQFKTSLKAPLPVIVMLLAVTAPTPPLTNAEDAPPPVRSPLSTDVPPAAL